MAEPVWSANVLSQRAMMLLEAGSHAESREIHARSCSPGKSSWAVVQRPAEFREPRQLHHRIKSRAWCSESAEALARLVGWSMNLAELAKPMRCSPCDKKAAEVVTVPRPRPRGVPTIPHSPLSPPHARSCLALLCLWRG